MRLNFVILASSHVMLFCLLLTACLALPSLSLRHPISLQDVAGTSQDSSLREVFQAYPPPISPKDLVGSTTCSFKLMNHVFGNSAGKPFIGMISQNIEGCSRLTFFRRVPTTLWARLGCRRPEPECCLLRTSI